MIRFILIVFMAFAFNSVIGQGNYHIWLQSRMDGNLNLADGTSTTFWGFGEYTPPNTNSQINLPGPLLRYNEGDTVNVHFFNNSMEDHTIHWHGLDVDQDNDGVPTTSSVVDPDALRVYTFVCTNAGTYNYHCHVLTTLHLSMGMYGMFVVDPDPNKERIYSGGPTYTEEYNWLASELDTNWTKHPTSPGPFYLYGATNFLINGKEGSQLTSGHNEVTGTTNDTIAMRLSNMGYGMVRYIFPAEANASIHMSDGRAIPNVIWSDTIDIYSGERYTLLLDPNTEFTGTIYAEYYDVRNNNLMGTNTVPMIIQNVGITENELDPGFKFYPNPVQTYFTIEVQNSEIKELEITDLSGRLISTLKVFQGVNIIPSNLPKGTYQIGNQESPVKVRFIQL